VEKCLIGLLLLYTSQNLLGTIFRVTFTVSYRRIGDIVGKYSILCCDNVLQTTSNKFTKKISKTSPPKSERPSPLTSQSPKQSTLQVLGKEQGGEDLAPSNEEGTPFIPSSLETCGPPLEGTYVCAPTNHVARGRARPVRASNGGHARTRPSTGRAPLP
jgi:hypothetical protein